MVTNSRHQAKSDEDSSSRRLAGLLHLPGKDLAWLARETGIPRTTLDGYRKAGGIKGATQAVAIAAAYGVTVEWLMTGVSRNDTGEPAFGGAEDLAGELGVVGIAEVDLALGMGAGFIDENHVQAVTRWIPTAWVRDFTDAPASMLAIIRPTGDSMYPTINDRDIILVDRSVRRIDRQDAIWALAYGGLGTIKRVRAMADGSYKLSGDNPLVRDETAHDDEMFVIGRVAGVIRRT